MRRLRCQSTMLMYMALRSFWEAKTLDQDRCQFLVNSCKCWTWFTPCHLLIRRDRRLEAAPCGTLIAPPPQDGYPERWLLPISMASKRPLAACVMASLYDRLALGTPLKPSHIGWGFRSRTSSKVTDQSKMTTLGRIKSFSLSALPKFGGQAIGRRKTLS